MKKSLFIFLAAIIAIMFTVFVMDGNGGQRQSLYVAMDGNDAYEGTEERPLRTLKKAALLAEAGTTVHIREGIYEEPLVIEHSGTKSNRIVFRPYQNDKVILSGERVMDKEGDTALITIDNKNYVTIKGLVIQDLKTDLRDETVMGIYITGSSSHIELDNNHIQYIETHANDGNAHGIAVYGTGTISNISITNNTVENLELGASEAIVLNGNVEEFEIDHNLVRWSNNIGIDLIGLKASPTMKKKTLSEMGLSPGILFMTSPLTAIRHMVMSIVLAESTWTEQEI